MTLATGYYLARRFRIFQKKDLLFLDYIKMPGWLKRAILWMYFFLASDK
jgi:hypothetical protein